MSSHCNPNIVEDGLVFLYDVDDIQSYKGEPTINYGPASFGDWGTESTAERIATGNTFNGQPTYNCRTVVGQSYRGIEKTISGLRTAAGSSGTVTMSCMVRNNNSTSYNMFAFIGHDFTSTRNIAANSDWQKVQWTVNQSSMNNDYVEFRPYTNNASIYLEMTMPMVEVNKGHATQFVDGTRSATQGLIDRTGNSTIDLSNVSFDSNAQMTFDGTDDYISAASFDMGTPTEITVECVIRFNGSLDSADRKVMHYNKSGGTNAVFQLRKGDSNSRLYYQAHNGSQWYTMTDTDAIESDTWAHFIITHSGTSAIMYKNGVQSATATMGNLEWTNANDLLIGYRTNSEYWKGDIAIMKIYNKALTSTEILQNYNAIKSRFSL